MRLSTSLEEHLELQAREAGAQAEVGPVPERDVRVVLAAMSKMSGVSNTAAVAVGRGVGQQHLVAGRDASGRRARRRG
jgi:hypothetical protein